MQPGATGSKTQLSGKDAVGRTPENDGPPAGENWIHLIHWQLPKRGVTLTDLLSTGLG